MKPILTAKLVHKTFGKRTVLNGIDLELKVGQVTGLIGENGAGKTTLLKVLAGFVRSTSGSVEYEAKAGTNSPVMFLIDRPAFFPLLSVSQTLRQFVSLSDNSSQMRVDDALSLTGLQHQAEVKTALLSMGQRQRLSWAHAILRPPSVLLLDEPTSFLDPSAVMAFRSTVERLASLGSAILMSSHNLTEVDKACDTVLVLANGSLHPVADDRVNRAAALESVFRIEAQ